MYVWDPCSASGQTGGSQIVCNTLLGHPRKPPLPHSVSLMSKFYCLLASLVFWNHWKLVAFFVIVLNETTLHPVNPLGPTAELSWPILLSPSTVQQCQVLMIRQIVPYHCYNLQPLPSLAILSKRIFKHRVSFVFTPPFTLQNTPRAVFLKYRSNARYSPSRNAL